MAVLVFIHEQCEQDAKKQGCFNDVLRLKDAILKDQRTTLFDNFPPPYLKKRFTRQQRLIAVDKKIGDHIVVCFLRLLIRGNAEYNSFIKAPKAYGDSHFLPLIEDNKMEKWLEDQLRVSPPPLPPLPNDIESRFLWSVFEDEKNLSNETIIYETEEWVNSVQRESFSWRLVQIPPMILEILEESGVGEGQDIEVLEKSQLRIVYRYFKSLNRLCLLDLKDVKASFSLEEIKTRYDSLALPEENVSEDDIIRSSLRGYPSLLLADDAAWIFIQKDKEANLALSPEETMVLASAYNFDQDAKHGFPLFINGRAGSGKSTILQYLFSDYLRCWLNLEHKDDIEPPLYLTYSGDLVSRSRTVIKSLLYSGFKKALRGHEYTEQSIDKVIPAAIRSFKGYLLGLLPEGIRTLNFREDNYVDYMKFRNLWLDKYGRTKEAQKYGPDICWHIIRTYIKGLGIDEYLDTDTYSEIPRDEKTVSVETYQWVFDNVWSKWYKPICEEVGDGSHSWDDQDLVRYILINDLIAPRVPVVFCDEAQDFTRIEQEMLLRSSLFSYRRLTSLELNRVPFAFAGDPFQTLNPTGFRWESIQASFVNKFVYSILPSDRYGATELNYRELSYNYRSFKDIVYFCNSIQLFRSVLFHYHDIQPQETWRNTRESQLPVYFYNTDPSVRANLPEQSDLRIIVPCGEGEERNYYENDDYLKELVPLENGVPRNIVSPTRVKGLEFNRVVVYGFGKYFHENFGEDIKSFSELVHCIEQIDSTEKILPIEYFINWLYVAVSRPKKRLIVVDTEKGIDVFWDYVKIEGHPLTLLQKSRAPEAWEDRLGLMQPGSDRSWGDEREDPLEVAEQYMQDGLDRKDPYFLRQAATLFKRVLQQEKYHYCMGYAFWFEGKYEESGEDFFQSKKYDKALLSFWTGAAYQKIASHFSDGAVGYAARLEVRFSNLVSGEFTLQGLQLFLDQWTSLIVPDEYNGDLIDINWSNALRNLKDKIVSLRISGEQESWLIIWGYIRGLKNKGLTIFPDILAEFSYRAKDYKSMVETGYDKHPDFGKAKLEYLSSLELKDLSEADLVYLGEIYRDKEKNPEKAWQYFTFKFNVSGIEKTAKVFFSKSKLEISDVLSKYKDILDAYVFHKNWKKALALVGRFEVDGEVISSLKSSILPYTQVCNALFTEMLADSAVLPAAETEDRVIVSEFLYEKYIKAPERGWQSFIHPRVLGGALERAGRFTDILEFYSRMMRLEKDTEKAREFEKRWIVNKYNYAKIVEKSDRDLAEKHREEARAKLQELNIRREDLPEFPRNLMSFMKYKTLGEVIQKTKSRYISDNKGVSTKASTRNRTTRQIKTFSVGNVSIKYSAENQRINLENNVDLTTAMIDLKKWIGKSDDLEVKRNKERLIFADWDIEAEKSTDNSKVFFRMKNHSDLVVRL
ncbi:MAG: hypothetical protein R3D58_18360 [Saprospiraceae bacterium]